MEGNTDYSKQVKKRFFNPKFMGQMTDPDAVGQIVNPTCNDTMKVYLKIDEKSKKIKDVKFQTMGCAAAIACSDITCELVKGKTLKEAKKIDRKKILKKLGGLPPIKEHCSLLGEKAIKMAIDDYEKEHKIKK